MLVAGEGETDLPFDLPFDELPEFDFPFELFLFPELLLPELLGLTD